MTNKTHTGSLSSINDTPRDVTATAGATPPSEEDTQASLNAQSEESTRPKASPVTLSPRTNLYASNEGWTLIVSLPHADQSQALLETEGSTFTLSVPHRFDGVYQRSIHFPKETTWGELDAKWEDDLLYIDLKKATPIKRSIAIS